MLSRWEAPLPESRAGASARPDPEPLGCRREQGHPLREGLVPWLTSGPYGAGVISRKKRREPLIMEGPKLSCPLWAVFCGFDWSATAVTL